jgi:ribosomal protein L24
MDIKLGDKVKILCGPYAGMTGVVVDIPRDYEAPDRFYTVEVDGLPLLEVSESALVKHRKVSWLWLLLGFAIGTAVAAVLVRGGV